MTPRLAANSCLGCRRADTVLGCQNCWGTKPGRVAPAHVPHAVRRQLGVLVTLATGPCFGKAPWRRFIAARLASLGQLVRDVVLLGAEEQMVGPNASRHIAAVKDEQTLGDGAVVQFPGEAVRLDITCAMPVLRQDAIAKAGLGLGPEPASLRLLHGAPEADLHRSGFEGVIARATTEAGVTARHVGRGAQEEIAAVVTETDHWIGHRQGLAARPEACAAPETPIRHVLSVSAGDEMIGIDAVRMVAAMTQLQPFSERTTEQLPRDPVSARRAGFALQAAGHAMARFLAGARPEPTTTGAVLVDPRPKSLGGRCAIRRASGSFSARIFMHVKASLSFAAARLLPAARAISI